MPRLTRLLIPPVTAAAVAAVLIAGRASAPTKPAPDRPADGRLSARDAQRVMRRVLARDQVAREVADGRRSVFAAAALFRALDRADPPVRPPASDPHFFQGEPLPVEFPAVTEGEAHCRRVALWTYRVLRPESPAQAVEVAHRLADEVRAEVRRRGAVELADPAGLADEAERLIADAPWVPNGPARNQ